MVPLGGLQEHYFSMTMSCRIGSDHSPSPSYWVLAEINIIVVEVRLLVFAKVKSIKFVF